VGIRSRGFPSCAEILAEAWGGVALPSHSGPSGWSREAREGEADGSPVRSSSRYTSGAVVRLDPAAGPCPLSPLARPGTHAGDPPPTATALGGGFPAECCQTAIAGRIKARRRPQDRGPRGDPPRACRRPCRARGTSLRSAPRARVAADAKGARESLPPFQGIWSETRKFPFRRASPIVRRRPRTWRHRRGRRPESLATGGETTNRRLRGVLLREVEWRRRGGLT
jgi:hypothetical protein